MFTIIAAVGKNNELGNNNKMLWHLPNDLKRFKKISIGHPLIMGRKTFESLPKILPGREHIIITRNKSYIVEETEDSPVIIYNSIDEMMNSIEDNKEYFVIGGGEIYRQLIAFTDKIYLTIIDKNFEADTFFPEIDYNQWEIDEKIHGVVDSKNSFPHTFITLKRKN